jgi:hypothetical protein
MCESIKGLIYLFFILTPPYLVIVSMPDDAKASIRTVPRSLYRKANEFIQEFDHIKHVILFQTLDTSAGVWKRDTAQPFTYFVLETSGLKKVDLTIRAVLSKMLTEVFVPNETAQHLLQRDTKILAKLSPILWVKRRFSLTIRSLNHFSTRISPRLRGTVL